MGSVWPARRLSSFPHVEETPWPACRQHWLIIQPAPSFESLLSSRQLKLICARKWTVKPKTQQNTMIDIIKVTENEMDETASFSNYR